MKQIILGTAGHIDHGKTSLIKAVTGIDTDRLKEEKRRGITIELGFASLQLPSGQQLGIVDVPGHEKFVKNMVAGATGIDIVAMIIAADEGVMPQTREHMEICELLGIKHGLVVLTKIDLVDEEWLELVSEDVMEFVENTFLADAPIIPVSSATGKGIDEFKTALDEISQNTPQRSSSGLFRLPVDRVFSMKGFGTVITGTLISGKISVGDAVMIYPSRLTSKVRGIQVHNQSVTTAEAGMRTAINFQGLEKTSIIRGDVISTPDALAPSYMLDISFKYLKSNKKPIKNRTPVRFHAGTNEILGNLILLDREELLPDETVVAQIRLESPVTLVKDDRFVLRSYSPIRTIGGGYIVNPIPSKHKRFKDEVVDALKSLVEHPTEEVIPIHIRESGYKGLSFPDLKIMTNMSEKSLDQSLQKFLSDKTILLVDKENRVFIHRNTFDKLRNRVHDYLEKYHKTHPLKAGMPKEELKSKFPSMLGAKLFNLLLTQLSKDEEIKQDQETVALSDHEVKLAVDQADIRVKILESYKQTGLTPPYFKDIAKNLNVDEKPAKDVLMLLLGEGNIIKVKEDLYFHADVLEDLKHRIVDFIEKNGEMTTAQFKDLTGLSRKYLIPLLEYYDARNVTIRVGDVRKLRTR